ncbi:hypothetical protein [Streptomyces sp. NPDC051219]|uniref:acyltransferase n=1 Tax=Streptomyces sp. NPDC051219 TaxID=3155283 RepID=UPI0034291049
MDEACLAGAQQLRDAGATVGEGVRAWLGELIEVGTDVEVADGATVVADRLRLGDGVRIGAGCDLRSGSIVIGAGTELLAGAAVLVADAFEIGTAGRIEQRVNITCRSFRAGKLFYFGHDSAVGYGGTNASTAHVRIGDRVALGPHSILNANFPIELADQVGSGCNLTMWTHGFHFGHRLLDGYSADFAPIRVDSNVWLGFHVTLLPGVHIEANTIVAAGAVVARSLPADVLAGGVPAKPIKPLTAKPVDAAQAARLVDHLLERWCEELAWKGVHWSLRDGGAVAVGDTTVKRWEPGEPVPPPEPGRTLVLLTVDQEPQLDAPREDTVVLGLREGRLTGRLTDVAHDLRDYLRRNALPCGDEETFRGLPTGPFARLQNPRQSTSGFLV